MFVRTIKTAIVSVLLLPGFIVYSQQSVDNKDVPAIIPIVKLSDNVTVKFGGFVRAEYYIDSRKTVGAIDDLFSFFPDKPLYDDLGRDMNEVVRNNLSIQATRFNATFTGPDVLKAKTTAFFEFDFTGGNTVNVRLRHGYIKLNWQKSEILIGKTWNPLAETIFPSVIGLNTGVPFRPFGRGDQLRITYKPSTTISILAAILYQSEHKSFNYMDANGTVGQNGDNIRANPIPDLHFQIQFKSEHIYAGLISEYKVVRPTTISKGFAGTFATDETIGSFAVGVFERYTFNKLTLQASSIYGQNLSELFQQGGYAVTSIDLATGHRTYTPSNSLASWINITYGQKIIVGLFGGYQKNLGFNDNVLSGAGTFLGRWQDIHHIYRISPSVKYTSGRFVLAGEVDYNVAAYGTVDYANKGKVVDPKEISAVRGIVAVTFNF